MRVLSTKSSRGNDIATLQHFLIGEGLYQGSADGIFGSRTHAAVVAWQQLRQLTADGFVGPKTWGAMVAAGMPVLVDADRDTPREPDGLRLLTNNEQRNRQWGRITFVPAPTRENPEGVRFTNDFETEHIVSVDCPVWGPKKIRLHRRVAEHYQAFMQAILAAGLRDRLRTNDGGHNARFVRGSRTTLSNHAWGTAFDVNAAWNPLGKTPAFIGDPGCVRELVAIGVEHCWYWGGWFKRRDGMHFEHL